VKAPPPLTFEDFLLRHMHMLDSHLQCGACRTKCGSRTISFSSLAYENTSAPLGVMVPSFTTRGYLQPVASKWRSAVPLPPEPSQFCGEARMMLADSASHHGMPT
jgi:hypothetical protein